MCNQIRFIICCNQMQEKYIFIAKLCDEGREGRCEDETKLQIKRMHAWHTCRIGAKAKSKKKEKLLKNPKLKHSTKI